MRGGALACLLSALVLILAAHPGAAADARERRGPAAEAHDPGPPTESVGPVSFVLDSGLFYTAQGTPVVEILVQVPYDQLPFTSEAGGYVARVDVVAVFESVSGHQVGGDSWSREIWVESYDETIDPMITYRARAKFALPPGQYALRLTCGGSDSDLRGEAYRILDVRQPPAHGQAVSDMWLGNCGAVEDSAGVIPILPFPVPAIEDPFVPSAGRVFGTETELACVEAEAYSFGGAPGDTFSVELTVLDERMNAVWSSEERVLKAGKVTPLEFTVPCDSLTWGGYYLVLKVSSGDVEVASRKSFEVDESRVALTMDLKRLVDLIALFGTQEELETLSALPESERQAYVDELWRKRDPDPSTPRNEFKVTFFKRLKEAKERFKERGVEGWETDRGKVYIRKGPPDRIDTRPGVSGSLSPYATYEIWYYDATNSRYVFEDFGGTGSYTLVEMVEG